MPRLVVVAGPNGSGKTTLVQCGVVATLLQVPSTSVNPDEVARELAGYRPPSPELSLQAAQQCDTGYRNG